MKKTLQMRRLRSEEIGIFRMIMMNMLYNSPDPYATIMYPIDVDPFNKLIDEFKKSGKSISLHAIYNKMLSIVISENPIANQIVFGNKVYQKEGVHIANGFLLPGSNEVLAPLIMENCQLKSLETIQRELKRTMISKAKEFSTPPKKLNVQIMGMMIRLGFTRLIGEKKLFEMGFEKGLVSNIFFLNHTFKNPSTFIFIKPVIGNVPVRIHAHSPVPHLFLENGHVREKQVALFSVTVDHRIGHGLHMQEIGKSLQKIAADPEKFLL
ncbi:hypothetical protein TRIP_B50191 [uncultured Desulfatiglans sp.]|uniref:2-oxoacid dehydrogenase acyltransferase catalytic domain-containing protein n=1 Tax=Uncultured Desulfatiglans sp. TaxID=1748965 RepID=A0A653AGS0_UNCDX|nr:hypothetical protein TRIP_B50191 [uncultured Desulfatiglans sp.]